MRTSRILLIIITILSIIILASLFVPKKTYPSDDTRIILEHNQIRYIAPICFEDAGASNFIEDSTLKKAEELEYEPNSNCTIDALKAEENSLFIHLLKELGVLNKKWDNW